MAGASGLGGEARQFLAWWPVASFRLFGGEAGEGKGRGQPGLWRLACGDRAWERESEGGVSPIENAGLGRSQR